MSAEAPRDDAAYEQCIELYQLRPGMVLSRDLTTAKGAVLLAKDFQMTDDMLTRVYKRGESEPLAEEIFVYRRAA